MTTTLRTAGIEAAREYQDLPAWQRAMTLAERIYAATENFPEREITVLAASMRSNAIAVASHIATASARTEYGIAESYSKSQSALADLATQIELASRLGYVADTLTSEIDEVGRLLIGLKHGLKTEAKAAVRKERDEAGRDREHAERSEKFEKRSRDFKPRDGSRGGDRPYQSRERSDRETSREERQYKPRGEFKPRDGGDRKPYADRKPYGDKKPYEGKRELKARDGEERPRREYKPRDGAAGDRKPYGEKKSYGDRKPYGDKKFGEKKPFKKPYRKDRD